MPVAYDQLQELMEIVHQELGPKGPFLFKKILTRFCDTRAYHSNKSFRDTVNRLLVALKTP